MPHTLILTGDINLMNLEASDDPFRLVAPIFKRADVVFANLECCLYDPPGSHAVDKEGFYAPASLGGEALRRAGIRAVGNANNVNYGEDAIKASNQRLDELDILHCGSGINRAEARKPVIVTHDGIRYGFLQRTSVYWPTNHEAGSDTAGVAVIRGHTAYQLPLHKTRPDIPPANRPGVPPIVITWADPPYLRAFTDDIAALRAQADVVVASCHWGLYEDVLDYMTEIAHAAIDAGADVVVGHGPHYSLPVEIYKGKPIFYGLGSFCFHTGHGGKKHGDWVGMLARLQFEGKALQSATVQFVRHNDNNETVPRRLSDEAATLDDLVRRSVPFATQLTAQGDELLLRARAAPNA
jgi:poly-gamma-glutamate capsule biosynthesis protein CapA/YwtB (metallophosphatase superfamily)